MPQARTHRHGGATRRQVVEVGAAQAEERRRGAVFVLPRRIREPSGLPDRQTQGRLPQVQGGRGDRTQDEGQDREEIPRIVRWIAAVFFMRIAGVQVEG